VIAEPANALEVKFSIAHLAAMAVLGRGMGVIADGDATDAEILAMRARVQLADDGEPSRPAVDLELADGSVVHAQHDSMSPESDLDAEHAKLADKFAMLVEPVLGPQRAGALRAAVDGLGAGARVRDLMALTVPVQL
jgi:hypothetical protein